MSTAQRVSRGFHWLGLFLAAIPLLVGGYLSAMEAPDWTAPFSAKWTLSNDWEPVPDSGNAPTSGGNYVPPPPTMHIKGVGDFLMSTGFEKLSAEQQQTMADQIIARNWRTKFAMPLAEGLSITLAVSLAVYALIRAIGWVIGGFAAS
jgi:hypothetical protein